MQVFSIISNSLHLNAALARALARPADFSGQCSYPPSLLQPAKNWSRQFLLQPLHSHVTDEGSCFSISSPLLVLRGVFLIISTYSAKSQMFCSFQFRKKHVPVLEGYCGLQAAGFPGSPLIYFVEVFDCRLFEPVLQTVVHKQILASFEVSERDLLQRLLLFVGSSRLHSCSTEPFISFLRSQSPGLPAVLISQQILSGR